MNFWIPNFSISFFGLKAECLLDFDFDGQAVHIVASPVNHVAAVHAVVAQDAVFQILFHAVPR